DRQTASFIAVSRTVVLADSDINTYDVYICHRLPPCSCSFPVFNRRVDMFGGAASAIAALRPVRGFSRARGRRRSRARTDITTTVTCPRFRQDVEKPPIRAPQTDRRTPAGSKKSSLQGDANDLARFLFQTYRLALASSAACIAN